MPSLGWASEASEPAKRQSSLYSEIGIGRDSYRSVDLSAQIGVDERFALPIGISRNENAFTDPALAFFVGGDWDLGVNLTPRVVLNYFAEPNQVKGVGVSVSNRFHLEGLWEGRRSSVLTLGLEGTRYSKRRTSGPGTTALEFSKQGRGRGGSTSGLLGSVGILQVSAWANWSHFFSDEWSIFGSAQKYAYLGAGATDGNAAISDRPFVSSQAAMLVDGFPEWSASLGGSYWPSSWNFGAQVSFSRARNSSSGVIAAPGLNVGKDLSEVLSVGMDLSHAIQTQSTLVSVNANWMW